MKNLKTFSKFLVFVLLVTISLMLKENVTAATNSFEAVPFLRKVAKKVKNKSDKNLAETRNTIEKRVLDGSLPNGVGCFLAAKIAIQQNTPNVATDLFVRSMHDLTMAPECLDELEKLLRTKKKWNENHYWRRIKQNYIDSCYGTLIPLSGRDTNQECYAHIQPRRPYDCPFDRSQGRNWIIIAKQFEELGYFDKAWRAYVEAGYLSRGHDRWNPDSKMWQRNGNFMGREEDQRSLFWCRAAICAHKAGEKEVAQNYLIKAATFGSDDLFDITKQIAQKWKEGKKVTPSDYKLLIICPPLKEKSLSRIVQMYMDLNAHPRAWMIIDQYPNQFDAPAKLRKKVQDDWLDLLRVFRCPPFAYVKIYGYQVYPLGNPLAVSIPWPFSKDTLECVSLRCFELRGELNRLETQSKKSE